VPSRASPRPWGGWWCGRLRLALKKEVFVFFLPHKFSKMRLAFFHYRKV
jgi:hypothetical protein